MCREVSGYSNYATFSVGMLIDNERDRQSYWQEQAREAYRKANADPEIEMTRKAVARVDLADQLRDEIREEYESKAEQLPDLIGQLLGFAFDTVDWRQLAKELMSEIEDDAPVEAGDKVRKGSEIRILTLDVDWLAVGNIYEVVRIDENGDPWVLDGDGDEICLFSGEYELVAEEVASGSEVR